MHVHEFMNKNTASAPIFSIRIRLKPLPLALMKIVQRQSKKLAGYTLLLHFITFYEIREVKFFPANPIGAEQFFSANRIGLK